MNTTDALGRLTVTALTTATAERRRAPEIVRDLAAALDLATSRMRILRGCDAGSDAYEHAADQLADCLLELQLGRLALRIAGEGRRGDDRADHHGTGFERVLDEFVGALCGDIGALLEGRVAPTFTSRV